MYYQTIRKALTTVMVLSPMVLLPLSRATAQASPEKPTVKNIVLVHGAFADRSS